MRLICAVDNIPVTSVFCPVCNEEVVSYKIVYHVLNQQFLLWYRIMLFTRAAGVRCCSVTGKQIYVYISELFLTVMKHIFQPEA